MKKAFSINGGAGRVLCSIPALEYYKTNVDKDLVVISEAWTELFMLSPILRDSVYPVNNKNLFKDKLQNLDIIVSPEPYRLGQYFKQQCNLIQAFDIEINSLSTIPETKKINLEIPKQEQVFGYNFVTQVRTQLNKDHVIVLQPFGSGAKLEGNFIIDSSGRSFELRDFKLLIEKLTEYYAVILMSSFKIPAPEKQLPVVVPENIDLIKWASIIKASDYFIGCDSVGQHLAHALDKPATVVIGSTYPENISYPHNKNFIIVDNGKEKRQYSPIRISFEPAIDFANEDLMIMSDESIKNIVDKVIKKLGKSSAKNKITAPKEIQNVAATNVSCEHSSISNIPTLPNFQKKQSMLDLVVGNK